VLAGLGEGRLCRDRDEHLKNNKMCPKTGNFGGSPYWSCCGILDKALSQVKSNTK